jgi:hypothetical protein
MNTEALFLFLILLLGLLLCSFLGGNCGREGFSGQFSGKFKLDDNSMQSSSGVSTASRNQYDNYNHYTGSSTQLSPGATFYGENGRTATVVSDSDGTQSLQIILPGSTTPVRFMQQKTKSNTSSCNVEGYNNYYGEAISYRGPEGATADIITTDNGQQAVKVTDSSGTYYYNTSGAQITPDTSTKYYGSTGYTIQIAPYTMSYEGPYDNSVKRETSNEEDYSKSLYYGPYSGKTSCDYYNTLPVGIPKSQIPPGQEDLYILKSQIVPPVCPACPSSSACPRQEPCPPCPACARCPEQAFECKKVPNYRATDSGTNDDSNVKSDTNYSANSGGYSNLNSYDNYSSTNIGSNYSNSNSNYSNSNSNYSNSNSNYSNSNSNYSNSNNNYPTYGDSNNQYLPAPVLNDFSTFGM